MSSEAEENMALARRFMEARVKGDLEAVDEMMAPDYVNHTSLLSVQEPDREGVKWATAQFSGAISNASIHFEDQLAQADKVVTRSVVHAIHDRGELMGVAPTGREMSFMPIFIHRKRRYLAGRQTKNEFNTAKPRPTHCKKRVFESLIRVPKEH